MLANDNLFAVLLDLFFFFRTVIAYITSPCGAIEEEKWREMLFCVS